MTEHSEVTMRLSPPGHGGSEQPGRAAACGGPARSRSDAEGCHDE
jgi:hypothetical protein